MKADASLEPAFTEVLSFTSICKKSSCTPGRAVMFEVKVIAPSIVPAIPEAVRQFRGSGLLATRRRRSSRACVIS
jgi:hypothetical protein